MKILHVLDHSIPLQSGYTFRTRAILRHQRALGWDTAHVTSAKHIGETTDEIEEVDGLLFYRTPVSDTLDGLPMINQYGVVRGLKERLGDVIRAERPDILHAHSPCLNGLAALKAAK
ncbi:MAG: glycosyltransferase, partial [Pseudomonadota bacterium]